MNATTHPNEQLARDLVAAFLRGDLDAVRRLYADDAVWDLPSTGILGGRYRGPDAIVGFLAKAFELSGGTLSVELYDVLGSDWGAVQVQRTTAAHDGRSMDLVEVLAHRIVDGRIVETFHRPDIPALDAFFG